MPKVENPSQTICFVMTTKEELQSMISEAIHNALNEKTPNTVRKKELMSQSALAEYLGKSIGSLINWRKQGFITAIKIGKSVFYDRERVLEEISQLKKIG